MVFSWFHTDNFIELYTKINTLRRLFLLPMIFIFIKFMNKRMQWAAGESIACDRLRQHWREILQRNFTIRGWELDILAQNNEILLCVEVKAVSYIDDIMSYITDKKMMRVRRTFQTYLRKYPSTKQPRIDVIFVQGGKVREVYENVTGT